MSTPAYVGRFAPSPTGRLHFGSVVAAIASWLDARAAHGRWLLRLDDLDRPRMEAGADAAILAELSRLGLEWDGPATRQFADQSRYHEAARRLREQGLAFPCACSRRDLVNGIYPGTCRNGLAAGALERSLRLRVPGQAVVIEDRIQGRYRQHVREAVGDFVVLRADGVVAYHLATAVDDATAGVTDVVRGSDLLDSTPRQVLLQQALGLPTPRYAHLPVVTHPDGQKLSKQTHAPDTAGVPAAVLWLRALDFLGQSPPATLAGAPLGEVLDWALAHWRLSRVPARARPGADTRAPPHPGAGDASR